MKKVKKIGVLSSLIAFIFVFTLATNGIFGSNSKTTIALAAGVDTTITNIEIGRASCRERVS